VCRAFLADGDRCDDGGTCGMNLYCDPGAKACHAQKADGTVCNANYECTTGGCNGRDAGIPGSCGQKGGPGTMCYATVGCSSSGALGGAAIGLCGALALLGRRRRSARSNGALNATGRTS
jgi:hypothetical protein